MKVYGIRVLKYKEKEAQYTPEHYGSSPRKLVRIKEKLQYAFDYDRVTGELLWTDVPIVWEEDLIGRVEGKKHE